MVPGGLPGGSSSGYATTVSLGAATIGLATDAVGSARFPASYQGLWGLPTTHGSVPTGGLIALAPDFDSVGLLRRTADLLGRAAAALLGEQDSARFGPRWSRPVTCSRSRPARRRTRSTPGSRPRRHVGPQRQSASRTSRRSPSRSASTRRRRRGRCTAPGPARTRMRCRAPRGPGSRSLRRSRPTRTTLLRRRSPTHDDGWTTRSTAGCWCCHRPPRPRRVCGTQPRRPTGSGRRPFGSRAWPASPGGPPSPRRCSRRPGGRRGLARGPARQRPRPRRARARSPDLPDRAAAGRFIPHYAAPLSGAAPASMALRRTCSTAAAVARAGSPEASSAIKR
jgi:Amidase